MRALISVNQCNKCARCRQRLCASGLLGEIGDKRFEFRDPGLLLGERGRDDDELELVSVFFFRYGWVAEVQGQQ
jgi:hypothetical protein